MTDLSTHYKERSPEETVQLIQNFFKSNDFIIEEDPVTQTESGTWFNHLTLLKNKEKIGVSNGKGMTPEYARASGYAELYERFCNGMLFMPNPYWQHYYTKYNREHYGYSFRKDEKRMSQYDWMYCCQRTRYMFDTLSGGNDELAKTIAEYISKGEYIGFPMKNIGDDNDILYMDQRLLIAYQHSVGMAAGNTIDEALVQGTSELIEKEGFDKFFLNPNETYYALELDKIENENIQEVIKNVKNAGYKLYFIDLAYTFNIPVILCILINPEIGLVHMNFGSFPVFDIAIERTLTEVYQGIVSHKNNSMADELQIPYRNTLIKDTYFTYGNSITGKILNENLIDRLQYKSQYNKEVYLKKDASNAEARQYYYELGNKLGYKFYYLNNSLSKDIAAVHILLEADKKTYTNYESYDFMITPIIASQTIDYLNRLMNFHKDMIENNPISYIDLHNLIFPDIQNESFYGILGEVVMWYDFISHGWDNGGFGLLAALINSISGDVFMMPEIHKTCLYLPIRKILQVARYVNGSNYSIEEILNIFNNIFNYNITKEDIVNCKSISYILRKGYVEPLREYISSDEYFQIIQVYSDNNPSL